MKRLFFAIVVFLVADAAFAQGYRVTPFRVAYDDLVPIAEPPAHADVVGAVKNDLLRSGADLSGSCGAFKITRAVAQALTAERAGLLAKPAGNNCDGFAVDIIVYPDGHAFDILTDSGGSNGPAWQPIAAVDPTRYRAVEADAGGAVVPDPDPAPLPTIDWAPLLNQLGSLQADLARLAARLEAIDHEDRAAFGALSAQLKAHDEQPAWITKVLGNRYVQIVIAAASTYVATHQLTK